MTNFNEAIQQPQAPVGITITIVMTPEGQVLVNGPLNDKVLCYGLLGAAQDAIRNYTPAEQRRIIPVKGVLQKV